MLVCLYNIVCVCYISKEYFIFTWHCFDLPSCLQTVQTNMKILLYLCAVVHLHTYIFVHTVCNYTFVEWTYVLHVYTYMKVYYADITFKAHVDMLNYALL